MECTRPVLRGSVLRGPVLRGVAALGVMAASFAGGAVVSAADASGVRLAGPTGACDWADPAAVADLPLIAALDELSELSTMSAAVSATDLSIQLDADGPFTVFAPSNDAFAGIPENVWDSIIADPELLSSILGYHVVVGEALSADDIVAAGSVDTLSGGLEVAADGDALVVNGGESAVTCAGIQTANATIFVIDSVLQPATDDMSGGGACPGSSVPGSDVPDASTAPGASIPPDASTPPDGSSPPDVSTPPGDSVPGSSVAC